MSKRDLHAEPFGGIELVERAVSALVGLPGSAWCVYLIGTVPFGLVLLYFFTDMSVSPYALERLGADSLLVTGCALWWRACQARFGTVLLASWGSVEATGWSAREWIMVALRQGAFLALFIFLSPIAMILVLPTGWLLAYFQEAVIFGGTPALNIQTLGQRSMAMIHVWQRQNHVAMLIATGFALLVFLNVYSFVFFVPFVLKLFTGIETAVTQSPLVALNTTVLLVVCYLSYLITSPLIRAVYVVRHYHGHSLKTGRDLQDRIRANARLREQAKAGRVVAVLLGGLLFCVSFGLRAQEGETASPLLFHDAAEKTELDRAIREVVQRPDFAWRLPSGETAADGPSNLSILVRRIGRMVTDLIEWIIDAIRPEASDRHEAGIFDGWLGARPLLNILLVVVAMVLVALLVRLGLRARTKPVLKSENVVVKARPDVDDLETLASDLPEDEWMRMAQGFVETGDYRRALRAYYLSCLAHLHESKFIRISKSKSNASYVREVMRRSRHSPEIGTEFRSLVRCFDRVWYGGYPIEQGELDQSASSVGSIRSLT